jgi:uroporphyrinogen decarboxylase
MTSKERVKKAINFSSPDKIPLFLWNRDQQSGDILYYPLNITTDNISEWGYKWETLEDGTMGQPGLPVIQNWDEFSISNLPKPIPDLRLNGLKSFIKQSDNHYLLAGLGMTGFSNYTFMRGFENSLIDLALADENAYRLLDYIFDFENSLITLAAKLNFDGVHFQDDWGTQDSLIISPDMWRKVFKPRYKSQFQYARQLGLDVWFHCCGNIIDIIEDFHEIGISVMNVSQPNVNDITLIGSKLKGKQCFMTPVSYQTTSLTGTTDEITNEAKRMFDCLGSDKGGFVGYIEEYSCLGMSEQNFKACINAFSNLNSKGNKCH